MIDAAFAIVLTLGAILSAVELAVRFRSLRAMKRPSLPAAPSGQLVLDGSAGGFWIGLAMFGSAFLLFAALGLALALPRSSWPLVILATSATVLMLGLNIYLDGRTAQRLELDDEGFQIGRRARARRVRWIHVTELRADQDLIRYRANRALVRGSPRRYWDGAIRNRWGVDTRQLLRLMQRYRERALETAPHYLTGRAEQSRS
jgi:hypothetical protein